MTGRYKYKRKINGVTVRWNGRVNYNHMPHSTNRDNGHAYNTGSGSGGGYTAIRVPSLRRNKSVWTKFYALYPYLKGYQFFRGVKLKQI